MELGGKEVVHAFSRLASYLVTRTNTPKSKMVCNLYGRLNLTLVLANTQFLLLRVDISSRRVIQVVLQHNFVFYLFICLFTGSIFHDITHCEYLKLEVFNHSVLVVISFNLYVLEIKIYIIIIFIYCFK